MKKIMLGAIAKNEGAYLYDWIFHHLYLGFDHLLIYVNNTDDSSCRIIDEIKNQGYSVEYVVCDYIFDKEYNTKKHPVEEAYLKRNKIQSCAYSEILSIAYSRNYDYLMFLDIDEFFIYKDLLTIGELLDRYNEFDIISIRWAVELGKQEAYKHFINKNIIVGDDKQFKSIVKLKGNENNITIFSSHDFRLQYAKRLMLSHEDHVFILHRMYRSEMEYFALLYRGDTFSNTTNGLKKNRSGYNFHFENRDKHDRYIKIDISATEKYFINYFLLLNKSNFLSESIKKEQCSLLNNVDSVRKIIDIHKNENRELEKILSGTSLSLPKIIDSSVDDLRDTAIALEPLNILLSYKLMKIANELRPTGPFLKQKLNEYKVKINKNMI